MYVLKLQSHAEVSSLAAAVCKLGPVKLSKREAHIVKFIRIVANNKHALSTIEDYWIHRENPIDPPKSVCAQQSTSSTRHNGLNNPLASDLHHHHPPRLHRRHPLRLPRLRPLLRPQTPLRPRLPQEPQETTKENIPSERRSLQSRRALPKGQNQAHGRRGE